MYAVQPANHRLLLNQYHLAIINDAKNNVFFFIGLSKVNLDIRLIQVNSHTRWRVLIILVGNLIISLLILFSNSFHCFHILEQSINISIVIEQQIIKNST